MIQLLVCTALCLLHLVLGLTIGIGLKGAPARATIARSTGAPQFVRQEVRRLAKDWKAIRSLLERFLSAADRVQPLPRDLLRQSLAELIAFEDRLRETIGDQANPPNAADTSIRPHDVIQRQLANLTDAQVTQLFEIDRSTKAAAVRHKFTAKQPMAPLLGDSPPPADAFRLTQCHDLSVREIRFFEDDRPSADRVLVGLGQPSRAKWLVAKIVDYRTTFMYGRTGYLVTAQFLAGIDTHFVWPETVSITSGE